MEKLLMQKELLVELEKLNLPHTHVTIRRWIDSGMPVEMHNPKRYLLSKVLEWLKERK